MKKSIEQQLEKIVHALNQTIFELYEHHDDLTYEHLSPFSWSSTGYGMWIDFFGFTIWHSEHDERDCDEDDNQEPLLDYIMQEVNKVRNAMDAMDLERVFRTAMRDYNLDLLEL